jgi:glucose/arabinose dehydrogenase
MRIIASVSLTLLLFASVFVKTLKAQPVLSFSQKITGLSRAVDIVNTNDGSKRIFIVQQDGTIKLYDSNFVFIKNFLVVSPIYSVGERGLLSMTFHPDHMTNRYFFVYYTNNDRHVELARYRTVAGDSNTADLASKQVIMTIERPDPNLSTHNGCDLNFGPDGNLYFGPGDGGGGDDPYNHSQNPNSLHGKMLRINVDNFTTPPYYNIPADNPYAASSDTLKEIWAFGLRNPWRWSFDRLTDDIWIADVGESDWEEINYIPAGTTGRLNFGWDCYEGDHPSAFPCSVEGDYVPPIFDYEHGSPTGGGCVIGGFVYRGTKYPRLYGYYIAADWGERRAWMIRPTAGSGSGFDVFRQDNLPIGFIKSFGQTENGEMLILSSNEVYEVQANSTLPVTVTGFSGKYNNGKIDLNWQVSMEDNIAEYEIEFSSNGTFYQHAGNVKAKNQKSYSFTHLALNESKLFYRLKFINEDGSIQYSKSLFLRMPDRDGDSRTFVVPSVITNRTTTLLLDKPYTLVQLMGPEGKEIWNKNITGRSGSLQLELPSVPQGHYLIKMVSATEIKTQKIIIQN